jgi:hypothetical protein
MFLRSSIRCPEAKMNSNDIKKNANDPLAPATPVKNPASQPHGTTEDQVNEMESEGQATKQGQSPNASPLGHQITPRPGRKPDEHKGAVEGDHASDKEQGNKNAVGALDKNGLPKNKKAIAEDSIGARADETQG